MSAGNLSGGVNGESIGIFLFNFDPLLDPTLLSFSVIDDSGAVLNGINTGVDAFMADGDGDFDIQFDFPQPPGQGVARFTGGESIIYDISYVSAISAFSFESFSNMGGGQGTFQATAKILRISGNGSGWIGNATTATVVPEPATGALVGLGLVALALVRRRRS